MTYRDVSMHFPIVPNERLERKVQHALMNNCELKEEIEAIGNEINVEKIG
jgi:hypothetical protein